MAVVKNLMIRIGADYSNARKGMEGATRELSKFRKETRKTTQSIKGKNGLGGISAEFVLLSKEVSNSLSRLKGAKGIGGVANELTVLVPLLGRSSTAMRGMGSSAAGLTRVLGPLGIGLSIVSAALGAATVGLYAVSQPAVKFESDLSRLNMQLKDGTQGFMDWARAQGIAKTSAVEMGATYSTLLSSFIRDTHELQKRTMDLVQATNVVASATGRTVEDTLERMRSGILGNTEAIEDLGIFVNVSMIESTKAFKRFAGDKSWEQLDFQMQQQIRLAAILEQAYARYGNELQNNVMTKQTQLLEQLKDVKLNLSQAFLPIWDAVLPALTRMAEGLANTTEQIARFIYWLRGWDYDEMTKGSNKQTDAVIEQGDAYEDLADSVAKARGQLAAFDEINQLGDLGGGSGSSGGSSGGLGGSGGGFTGGSGSAGGGFKLPELPSGGSLPGIVFDPPQPPDAGIGAVATAVTNTVNELVSTTRERFAKMWADINDRSRVGAANLGVAWNGLWADVNVRSQSGAANQSLIWNGMWAGMLGQTLAVAPVIQGLNATLFNEMRQESTVTNTQVTYEWEATLSSMLTTLRNYSPQIILKWDELKENIVSIKNPLAVVKLEWHNALDYMQEKLNAYRPYIEWGLHLIKASLRSVETPLADLKVAWSATLADMYSVASSKLGGIISKINDVIAAWNAMIATLTGSAPRTTPVVTPTPSAPSPASSLGPVAVPTPSIPNPQSFIDSLKTGFQQIFSSDNLARIGKAIQDEANKPQNQIGLGIYATLMPLGRIGGAAGGLLKSGKNAVNTGINSLKNLLENLKGMGYAVPSFANGGVVYGPTLAMVGDNPRPWANPEIIGPSDDIADIIQTAVANGYIAATQLTQNSGGSNEIVLTIEGTPFARVALPFIMAEQQRIGESQIRTT